VFPVEDDGRENVEFLKRERFARRHLAGQWRRRPDDRPARVA
jgi:hypothetical protein